jgi:hypothetical protein
MEDFMSDTSRHDSPAVPSASPQPDVRRRRFLMAFGAGAAGAAAPAMAGPAAMVAPTAAPPESTGYRETEHIRSYYASTRL